MKKQLIILSLVALCSSALSTAGKDLKLPDNRENCLELIDKTLGEIHNCEESLLRLKYCNEEKKKKQKNLNESRKKLMELYTRCVPTYLHPKECDLLTEFCDRIFPGRTLVLEFLLGIEKPTGIEELDQ